MVRAIIQYETEPDAERYARHLEEFVPRWSAALSVTVKIFGSPFGEPSARYYAEFEWDDMDAVQGSDELGGIRRVGSRRDGDGHPLHGALRLES